MWSARLWWKLGGVFAAVCLAALLAQLFIGLGSADGSVGAIIAVSLLLGCAAAGLTFWVVWSVRRPVADVIAVAKAMASGDYDYPIALGKDAEFGDLARAFDRISRDLAERMEQVRHRGDQLGTVLGSMAEGVLALDRDRHVLFANRAARDMLEINQAQVERRPLLEVVRHPEVEQAVAAALQDHSPKRAEVEILGKTRRQVALHVTRLPGEPSPGMVLVFHDVTELRRLERLRQDFVANVSHELKTPLTAIKAFAETLLDGAINDPEHNRQFVQRIEGQALRLEQLIVDLLSLARVEAGQEQFDIVPLDLSASVADRVAAHTPLAEAKRIGLVVQPASEPVLVMADEEGLREIIDNLVDNALKYTPEDGRVTIRWHRDNGQVVLEVEDTGIGISPKDCERVFERFYRVDKARSRELGGTGLGLSIVKHLVQAFGGSVAVTSQLGKGSAFSVRLPQGGTV
jgi:two-component system phosphate regulon sensor histidine kinase PhoR